MTTLTLATWNVNSIKARITHVLDWLKEASPDIVCLQELKCETDKVPYLELEELGYNVLAHGQKTYNGVAILSKFQLELVTTELPGDAEDDHARFIEAEISLPTPESTEAPMIRALGTPKLGPVLRVASIYVPNGGQVGSDKFAYKMRFYERLRAHAARLLEYDEPLVLAADYNVAPMDLDVFAPDQVRGTTCFHPDEHKQFKALEFLGLSDAFRSRHPAKQQFSWWDYRAGARTKNHGYRIDHLLCSPQAADCISDSWIDEAPRDKEKASDHTPVCVELALN